MAKYDLFDWFTMEPLMDKLLPSEEPVRRRPTSTTQPAKAWGEVATSMVELVSVVTSIKEENKRLKEENEELKRRITGAQ